MNVFVLLIIAQIFTVSTLVPKCVRAEHLKEKTGSKKYECTVRVALGEPITSNPSFKDGYCQNCGCHASDHDAA